MKARARMALLKGAYICQYAYPEEYAYLCEPGNADVVNAWLSDIDMRLSRLADDGAFVMTHAVLRPSETARVRDDMARFRDVYGPYVRMLQFIRSGSDSFTLQPGQFVQLAELNQAVNESATLEEQLKALRGIVHNASARLTNSEMLKRLLGHLKQDGYLILYNEGQELYQTTGKVTQLSQILTFIAENSDIVGRETDGAPEDDQATGLFD